MRGDRWTDRTKLIFAFHCFAKAVIKKKGPDNGLYHAETSSLTDLHSRFVLTAFCDINISCFECASELYSFPETLKTLKRKKFALQKICKIYISGNIKHVYTSLEICMCAHGRMITSHGPYSRDLCAECLYAYSESAAKFRFVLLFLAISVTPFPHHYISLYGKNI
jgi:hypothetical protein